MFHEGSILKWITKFDLRCARILLSVAIANLAATATFACEVEKRTWPNLLISITTPDAQQFWLNSTKERSSQLVVSLVTATYDLLGERALKRIRIAHGHPVQIQEVSDRRNDAGLLNFRSAKGAFDGRASLMSGTDNRVKSLKFIAPNPDGLNYLVAVKYKNPVSINDAVDDAVCAFQKIPEMLALED